MWHAALIVLLVAYLPGAVLFRCPLARRALRAGLPAEERLFWAVVISVALSTSTALLLAAAGSYSIERLLWLNGLVTLGAVGAARGNLRLGAAAPGPTPTAALPIALLLAAAGTFFFVPPAEYVMGGRDPGVYVNEGIQITQRGSLTSDEQVVASLPPVYRSLFFGAPFRPPYDPTAPLGYESTRMMGFFNVDTEVGKVVGQFPHAYPVWVAIAYDAAGLTGARYAVGLWALLGVLAVYFAGARWLGRPAAFAGAGLLALHVAQVWYARFPNADVVMQALLFAGLLAQARAQADDDGFFAPVAAGLLGLSVFAHFTGILAIGAAGVAAVLGRCAGQRPRAAFLLPLIGLTAAAAVYYLVVLTPYSTRPILYVRGLTPLHLALLAGGGCAMLALAVAAGRARFGARVQTWLPRMLLAAVWVLAAYGLFFREAGRQAGAARRRRTAHLYRLLPGRTRSGRRPRRVGRRIRTAVLARAAVLHRVDHLLHLPLLQAARRARALLDGPPLRAGDPAGVAPADRRGGVHAIGPGRLAPVLVDRTLADRPGARGGRRRAGGLARLGVSEPDPADPAPRGARRADSQARGSGRPPRAGRSAPGGVARGVGPARARHPVGLHLRAQCAAAAGQRARQEGVSPLSPMGPVPVRARPLHGRRRHRPAVARYDAAERLGRPLPDPAVRAGARRPTRRPYAGRSSITPSTICSRYPCDPGSSASTSGRDDDLYVRRIHAKQRDERGVTYRWTRDRSFVSVIGTLPDARALTLHLSDGGRPGSAPPARVQLTLDGPPARYARRRGRIPAVQRPDFFRPWPTIWPRARKRRRC